MNAARRLHLLIQIGVVLVLSACGVGGLDQIASGGTSGTGFPITSSGVMRVGSVVLNGVRFEDSAATVSDDRARDAGQLADGMFVKLRGLVRDDGVNGTAERVEVRNEVRARIQSINPIANPQSFVVGGLTVLVSADTRYANATGFSALSVGTRVEVHGLRDVSGQLRASRVEVVAAAAGADELRGRVSNPDPGENRFTLNGNVTVNFEGATLVPAGTTKSALTSGAAVEVHGSFNAAGTVFTAVSVELEDLSDPDMSGREGEKREVEGFVSGFTAQPGVFQVNGRSVQTNAATRFVGGTATDLANNVEIEVKGTIVSGVLVASEIEFEHARVELRGKVSAVDPSTRTITVLGQTVVATDLTEIETRVSGGEDSRSLSALVANVDCVEVRATTAGSQLVADQIKEQEECGKDLVQARVSAKNEFTFTLRFFGNLDAVLGGTGVVFRGHDDQSTSRAAFFAAVTPAGPNHAGTLVKVRGTMVSGTLVAELAELED